VVSGTDTQARKRQRRGEVEARLREAITTLAAESTFRDLRVEEIAAAAGLSRSAFYFYYPGKLELLLDATQRVSEQLFEQADRWYSGSGDSKVLIVEVLRDNASTWAQHADLLRMATEVASYDEEISVYWRGLVDRFVRGVAGRVRRDQEAGLVSADIDPESCAEILVYANEAYFLRNVAWDGGSPEDAARALAPIWLRTLYRT